MRVAALFVVWSISLAVAPSALIAQEVLPPAVPGRTDYEELEVYGDAVRRIREYRDNQFLYEARVQQLMTQAPAFHCATIQFYATVERVTKEEVFVRIPDAGKTRMLLQHADPPFYGNLRSHHYRGSYSTLFYNNLAKPVALRIGSEIPLEMAVHLRRNDQLLLQGQIGWMHVRIDHAFNPRTAATITNWIVLNVDPAEETERQ